MVNPKPARASRHTKRTTRNFSLVPAEAQQQMYRALCALDAKISANGNASGDSGFGSFQLIGGITNRPAVESLDRGAEIAEIATCLAAGASSPLVLACPAPGARIVSLQRANIELGGRFVDSGRAISERRSLTSATLAAMEALLTLSMNGSPDKDESSSATAGRRKGGRKKQAGHPREEAAIVCAGVLDAGAEAERDYRAAFRFAGQHKLPILYVIANRLTPSKGKPLDLRSIYPEFGIPLFTVDANDAIAAYRVATEALHNARHLRGPSVIEALIVPHADAASPLQLLTAYMERHGNPPQ